MQKKYKRKKNGGVAVEGKVQLNIEWVKIIWNPKTLQSVKVTKRKFRALML